MREERPASFDNQSMSFLANRAEYSCRFGRAGMLAARITGWGWLALSAIQFYFFYKTEEDKYLTLFVTFLCVGIAQVVISGFIELILHERRGARSKIIDLEIELDQIEQGKQFENS